MYNINTYRNREDCKILFEHGNLFVVKQYAPEPLGDFYLVSDSNSMFTTSIKPELTALSITNSIIAYEDERLDGIRSDVESDLQQQNNYEHGY